MRATQIFHQKLTLKHVNLAKLAILEVVIWQVPKSKDFPEGLKYRAWFSESGKTLFGFDNHKPKGHHLHIRDIEVGYVFRGYDELLKDIRSMIEKEGYLYEEK